MRHDFSPRRTGFLSISQEPGNLCISMRRASTQRNTGCFGLFFSSLFALLLFGGTLGAIAQQNFKENAQMFLAFLLPGLMVAFFFYVSLRILLDRIVVRITEHSILYEKNGYFGRRKRVYPRSEVVRITKNIANQGKYDSARPVLEIVLLHDTFQLVCRDAEEQREVEILLRDVLGDVLDEKSTGNFRTKIEQTDEALRIHLDPDRRGLGTFFVVSLFYIILILWVCIHTVMNANPNQLWNLGIYLLLFFVLLVFWCVMMLKTGFQHKTYTFSGNSFRVEFRCLGFSRSRVYDLEDLRAVEQDYRGNAEQSRIRRCVSLQFPREKISISVDSMEEQGFLAEKIHEFLNENRISRDSPESRDEAFSNTFQNLGVPIGPNSRITEQDLFGTLVLRIPIRSCETPEFLARLLAVVIPFAMGVFSTSLFFMGAVRGNLLVGSVFGFLSLLIWTLCGSVLYLALWSRFGIWFVEMQADSLRAYRKLGFYKSGTQSRNLLSLEEIRSPDPSEILSNRERIFGAKYCVQLCFSAEKPITLPASSLDEQKILAEFFENRFAKR